MARKVQIARRSCPHVVDNLKIETPCRTIQTHMKKSAGRGEKREEGKKGRKEERKETREGEKERRRGREGKKQNDPLRSVGMTGGRVRRLVPGLSP